jgi:hypothetical protein
MENEGSPLKEPPLQAPEIELCAAPGADPEEGHLAVAETADARHRLH